MAGDNTENTIANKNGEELVRDEHGRIVSGVLNPNGRPPKGQTMTDIMRDILEEELPSGKQRKEALVRKVLELAYEGNETMIRMAWSYLDGLPKGSMDITSGGKVITPIYGGLSTNNSDQKDLPTTEEN